MNRRKFVSQAAWVSAGSLFISPLLLPGCSAKDLFSGMNYEGRVLIIGAGAAGLYAGYLLKMNGIDFTIVEAGAEVGGRLGKLTGFADYDIDTGAQWMHGRHHILGDLAAKAGTMLTRDETALSYWFNQQIVDALPRDPFIFEGEALPDISFRDYAHDQGYGPEYDNIIEAIAGDQGAAASALSAYWNYKDEENWVSGDEDYKFRATYFDFFYEHVAAQVIGHVRLNSIVSEVDYTSDTVAVTLSGGEVLLADKVIVTVPVAVLKLEEILFSPRLPAEKTEAFSRFGMGPGMKVFLKFTHKFYSDNLLGGAVCAAYIDDTVGKVTQDHVLMAFVMGDQAAALHALGSDEAITQALLTELDLVYNGQASPAWLASSIHDYTDRPFIRGAYGYSTVGMGDARSVAARPVDNKIFFAGEAMNTNGHHQTVQGAVESACKAVIDLIDGVAP